MARFLQAGQNLLEGVVAAAEKGAEAIKEAQRQEAERAKEAASAAQAQQGQVGAGTRGEAAPSNPLGGRGPPQPARAPPDGYRPPPGSAPRSQSDAFQLRINVHECDLARVFDNFKSTQDVYVQLYRGFEDGTEKRVGTTQTQRGTPQNDNGKHPIINESFLFKRAEGKLLIFKVFAEHNLRGDMVLGEAAIQLDVLWSAVQSATYSSARPRDVPLVKSGKQTGSLKITILPEVDEESLAGGSLDRQMEEARRKRMQAGGGAPSPSPAGGQAGGSPPSPAAAPAPAPSPGKAPHQQQPQQQPPPPSPAAGHAPRPGQPPQGEPAGGGDLLAVPGGKQDKRPLSPRVFRRNLEYLLDRPEELEDRVTKRFRQIAKPVGPQGRKALSHDQMIDLVELLAEKLAVSSEVFGEIGQMFWRFEITGHQVLYEPEAVKLIIFMLRTYRDHMRPPEKGHVQLGGTIVHRSPDEKYQTIKELGRGGQGIASLAVVKKSDPPQQVVLKIYSKSNKNAPVEEIAQEFELLTTLKHPKIARVYDIFEDYRNVYIVMEPYFGGDLTKLIQNAQEASVKINETWFSKVIAQVLSGVDFLHSHLVMHCDLKEPNVMVVDKSSWEDPQVIVIDFGLANKFSSKSYGGGTPGYIPPEVWETGLWTPRGDIFSVGVMMYALWAGENPFVKGCSTIEEVSQKTMKDRPALPFGSSALRNLVYHMMNPAFLKRPVSRQVLQDNWFRKNQNAAGGEVMPTQALAALAQRQQKSEMYKALLADVASRENLGQLKELNELFVRLDGDNDGVVSAADVRYALKGRWSDGQIEALIQALMGANEGEVNYEEFMGQMIAGKDTEEDAILQKVFKEADSRNYGVLTTQETLQLLNGPNMATWMKHQKKDALTLIREMDSNGDGKISFAEFKGALQGKQAEQSGSWPQKGMPAEYKSASFNQWIPCTVTAVDPSGAIQVDVKPGYWLQGEELRTKVRPGKPGRGGEVDQQQAKKAGVGRALLVGAYGGGGGGYPG
mmetsp:Transcript_26147/g.60981  ORF Transcript_26147/g.60981 Transcript_26147/m.60981 type:complete len:1008 (-) Transcript_26147:16-3039(-)